MSQSFIDKFEIQNDDMGREFDRCEMCNTEIFVGMKYCEKCKKTGKPYANWRQQMLIKDAKIKDMPRVHRDAMNDGTWIDGKFWSDKELLRLKNISVTTSEGIVEYNNMFISTPHDTPNPFYDQFMRGIDNATIVCPNKHEQNAMRNLGCRGKMGYKESFYDRWPTKKSRIGWMFYFGEQL